MCTSVLIEVSFDYTCSQAVLLDIVGLQAFVARKKKTFWSRFLQFFYNFFDPKKDFNKNTTVDS